MTPSLSLCPRRPGNDSKPVEGEDCGSRLGRAGTSGSPGPTGHVTWAALAPASHGLCFGDWSGAGGPCVSTLGPGPGRMPGPVPACGYLSLALCGSSGAPTVPAAVPGPGDASVSARWPQSCWQCGGAVGRAGCLGHYLELGCVCLCGCVWVDRRVCVCPGGHVRGAGPRPSGGTGASGRWEGRCEATWLPRDGSGGLGFPPAEDSRGLCVSLASVVGGCLASLARMQ